VRGGKRAAGFNAGHFYEPTVLTNVTDDMTVFAEENFGPVAAITSFRDDDEALARANASAMGLSAYAFTASPERAALADRRLTTHAVMSFPHGEQHLGRAFVGLRETFIPLSMNWRPTSAIPTRRRTPPRRGPRPIPGDTTMQRYIPWTEDELRQEIARLDNLIAEQSQNDDKRSRCAVSYLRQVVKDKQDTLHLLRMRQAH